MRAEFEEILTDIEDGLKRVDNIVSDLRTFTHPGEQASEATDVADILNLALALCFQRVERQAHFTVELNIQNEIFDPFFTTKDVGEGMGLGLSICYRIVQGYGGTISVASEPGKFCEFTLEFPAKAEAAAQTKPPHAEPIRL